MDAPGAARPPASPRGPGTPQAAGLLICSFATCPETTAFPHFPPFFCYLERACSSSELAQKHCSVEPKGQTCELCSALLQTRKSFIFLQKEIVTVLHPLETGVQLVCKVPFPKRNKQVCF